MPQPINWNSFPKSKIVALKQLLQQIINLIKKHDELTLKLGFEVENPIEPMSMSFSVYIANFDQTLAIGKTLEQIYTAKLNQFTSALKNN
jgi:hypothetical protein